MESSIDDPKEKREAALTLHQYDTRLALAFQEDCEDLLNKFSKSHTYDFGAFAELWRETCFISIFEGQEYLLMIKAFIESCYLVVKQFLFFSDPYIQVGALYILYSLYYKQPISRWVKIRLTQSETDKIVDIVNTHKQMKRWHILFIYSKMRVDGAFQYCALSEPLSLNSKLLQHDLKTEGIDRQRNLTRNPLEKFKNLMEKDPLLENLEKTNNEYQNLISKYTNKCKQLCAFPSTIRSELNSAYDNIIENCSSNSTSNSTENNEELNQLKEIKTRAMTNSHATYRAERSVITGLDVDNFFNASSSEHV